jgi:lipid A 4'-phosphatase
MRILPPSLLISFVLVALAFYLFPQVDLWFSNLFYTPEQGFYLGDNPVVVFIYLAIPIFTTIMSLSLIGLLVYTWLKGRRVLGLDKKAYTYLLLVLLIGPGLLSSIFKDNWHRARPASIEQFGGNLQFTPAYVISDQCDTNCSFFSGHPTSLYFFIAVALVAPPAYRRRFMILAIGGGLVVGLGRVMQGGHFFSDVITSGFMVAMTAYLLYWWMYRKQAD